MGTDGYVLYMYMYIVSTHVHCSYSTACTLVCDNESDLLCRRLLVASDLSVINYCYMYYDFDAFRDVSDNTYSVVHIRVCECVCGLIPVINSNTLQHLHTWGVLLLLSMESQSRWGSKST